MGLPIYSSTGTGSGSGSTTATPSTNFRVAAGQSPVPGKLGTANVALRMSAIAAGSGEAEGEGVAAVGNAVGDFSGDEHAAQYTDHGRETGKDSPAAFGGLGVQIGQPSVVGAVMVRRRS